LIQYFVENVSIVGGQKGYSTIHFQSIQEQRQSFFASTKSIVDQTMAIARSLGYSEKPNDG